MTAAKNTPVQKQGDSSSIFPLIAIPLCFVLSVIVYMFVFGDPSHFVDNDPTKDPLEGDFLGIIYKGGWVVPILLGMFFVVIVFIFERIITLNKAAGSGKIDDFVRSLKVSLDKSDLNSAIAACDKQKGSVANVVRAGLVKYGEMEQVTGMEKDEKILAIQKEVEEATTLELPMLEKNLNVLATLASLGTLVGLIGTVLGMIRAFAALAHAGAPDSTALATGISEALINTALGISTSAFAILFYNYFTAKIDGMTYRIDEAGYSLTQTYASQHK